MSVAENRTARDLARGFHPSHNQNLVRSSCAFPLVVLFQEQPRALLGITGVGSPSRVRETLPVPCRLLQTLSVCEPIHGRCSHIPRAWPGLVAYIYLPRSSHGRAGVLPGLSVLPLLQLVSPGIRGAGAATTRHTDPRSRSQPPTDLDFIQLVIGHPAFVAHLASCSPTRPTNSWLGAFYHPVKNDIYRFCQSSFASKYGSNCSLGSQHLRCSGSDKSPYRCQSGSPECGGARLSPRHQRGNIEVA